MSASLRSRLNAIAATLAEGILEAVRGSTLDDLRGESPPAGANHPFRRTSSAAEAGPPRRGVGPHGEPARGRSAPPYPRVSATEPNRPSGPPGRLSRRSLEDIGAVVEQIVNVLSEHPEGLRAEQIRDILGLDPKELPRPLKEGLVGDRFTKSGQKRATTYSLKPVASSAKASGGA